MPLVPVDIKTGFYQNGTEYSGKNRWRDGSLVRWVRGALTPIGGWQRRQTSAAANIAALYSTPSTEATRNSIAWRANDATRHFVFATNAGVYHVDSAGAVTDITITGFTSGDKDSSYADGFGKLAYGDGAYGTPRTGTGLEVSPVASWEMHTWGEDLLLATRGDTAAAGKLYDWSVGDLEIALVAGAPTGIQGFIVTNERMVMTIGDPTELRTIKWSDEESTTTWTETTTNTAGSIVLQGSGRLKSISRVKDMILILSETDVVVGRYVGMPFVYGFEQIGGRAEPLSPNAVVATSNFAIWPTVDGFKVFDGTLQDVPCDVFDFFEDDLDLAQQSKTYGVHNSEFHEITWFYQSTSSTTTEPDKYISYNYVTGEWLKGELDRTTGVDKGVAETQIYVSSDGYLYNHELEGVTPDGTIYAETGPLEIQNGEAMSFIDNVFPDEETQGQVSVTFKSKDMPNATEYSYGPYTLTNPTPVRVRGRQHKMRLDHVSGFWKVGKMRFNLMGGGRR